MPRYAGIGDTEVFRVIVTVTGGRHDYNLTEVRGPYRTLQAANSQATRASKGYRHWAPEARPTVTARVERSPLDWAPLP